MRPVEETEHAWRGRNPREAVGLTEPLAWCPLEERSLAKGKTLGEASPGMESLDRLGEPRQAWRAWSLAKISEDVVGPGRPARGTLVSTVPTVAPRPTMGTPKARTEAKHRGPKGACLGRDTWGATVAPETTIPSASTCNAVVPATS